MTNNYTRFRSVLPAAATFSKDPRCFIGEDQTPDLFALYGYGSKVVTKDKVYTDWICSLGANILGYSNEQWREAVTNAVIDGVSFSLPHELEFETAELLVDTLKNHVPGWNNKKLQVRFAKTGSECTAAAIRLARAVTRRDFILRCSDSYLGWNDTCIATTPPAFGVPYNYTKDTILFNFGQDVSTIYRSIENEQKYGMRLAEERPACVILEQGIIDPPANWYNALRDWCTKSGTLLILDETASGFRYGLGGAAERFNIKPDLACYGKALGNGVSISALVGPKEYMDWFARTDPVFVSGTFCGETTGLAGAKATLEVMLDHDVNGHLVKIGGALQKGLTEAFAPTPVKVVGHDVRHILQWPSDEWHAYVVRGMLDAGILANRPNYSTWAHTMKDVEYTVGVAKKLVATWQEKGLPEYKPESLPKVLFRHR